MLPMIAATRPTPVKKPRAEDLTERKKERKKKQHNMRRPVGEFTANRAYPQTFPQTVKTLADLF